MSGFDVEAALRWARRAPRRTLARRDDAQLPFASEATLIGSALLLDTCVYIDQMQARAPALVARLVDARTVNHSMVAVQEMMHAIGRLAPRDPRTPSVVAAISRLIQAMPGHRVFSPDAEVLGRGALLAGILCRLQGYERSDRLAALHDCVLFLQAQKLGATLLSANVADCDLLLQLVPAGRVLLYRATG